MLVQSPPLGGTLGVHRTSWTIPFPRHACMFLVLGCRGAWVSHAPPRVPKQCRPYDAALHPVSASRLAGSPAWQGLPQCPAYGHWASYCCVALVFGSGLCLGSGVGYAPPLLAGVLGGCVWLRVVVSPFLSRLGFAVFAVGLRFRPLSHHSWLGFGGVRGCVRAPPVPRRSRLGCAVWVCMLGFGLASRWLWGGFKVASRWLRRALRCFVEEVNSYVQVTHGAKFG